MQWRVGMAQQQALFYRSLATLYNAGIHITRALRILSEQMEHPAFRQALADISKRVDSGRRLSDSMAQHGLVFPPLHSSLVALGEQTGSLHLVLEKLARQAERSNELRARLKAALTYPLVIFVIALGLLMAAPAVIFKDLLRLLQELQVQLPLTTRVLVTVSKVLSSFWVVVPLLVVFGLGVVGWRTVQNDLRLRRRLESLVLTVPGLGPAVRASVVCDFTRALATCYTTGVPMLRGLELSAGAADHLVFKEALLFARDKMRDGLPLHEALADSAFFPGMTVQMVAVGEESGRLADMLERVSALAETEVEQTLAVATAMLQPIMLLFIGFVVGFVVIATMSPMLQVINSL